MDGDSKERSEKVQAVETVHNIFGEYQSAPTNYYHRIRIKNIIKELRGVDKTNSKTYVLKFVNNEYELLIEGKIKVKDFMISLQLYLDVGMKYSISMPIAGVLRKLKEESKDNTNGSGLEDRLGEFKSGVNLIIERIKKKDENLAGVLTTQYLNKVDALLAEYARANNSQQDP